MYDLKKVIEANTVEGVIDYDKVMGAVDTEYVNPIVAKKTDKEKLTNEAVSAIVQELGIDGKSIDDLKLYVKQMGGNTDEVKEANLLLEKSFKDLETKYNTEVDTRTKLELTQKEEAQTNLIKGLGITDEKQIKYLKWDFNNSVTEDKPFDTVVAEYAKENKLKTTQVFVKDEFGGGSSRTLDIGEAWKNRRK